MRNMTLLAVTLMLFTGPANANDHGRYLAGKLTKTSKPPVRVLSDEERVAMEANLISFDLSVDPEQIVCRRERASRTSRIMTRRCRTVAEIRTLEEMARNESNNVIEMARRRQIQGIMTNVRSEKPRRQFRGVR